GEGGGRVYRRGQSQPRGVQRYQGRRPAGDGALATRGGADRGTVLPGGLPARGLELRGPRDTRRDGGGAVPRGHPRARRRGVDPRRGPAGRRGWRERRVMRDLAGAPLPPWVRGDLSERPPRRKLPGDAAGACAG